MCDDDLDDDDDDDGDDVCVCLCSLLLLVSVVVCRYTFWTNVPIVLCVNPFSVSTTSNG